MSNENKIPVFIKFPIAGISGVTAAIFVHPLDLMKNHMQLSGMNTHTKSSVSKTAIHIYQTEGIKSFYLGLSAGLLRQATYGSFRIGTYMWFTDNYKKKYKKPPDFYEKLLLGSAAGVCGSIVGNPSEVVLIRMTADSRLPLTSRRNYQNAINAVIRIANEEGILALWRGFTSTMTRAIVANAAELSAYSQSKHYLLSLHFFKDDVTTHIICSTIAAFTNVSFSMPIDITKTRIQNMKVVNNIPEYKGMIDVVSKIIKNEGVFALWKGFTPSFSCIAPRTILMFVFIEYLSKAYCKYVLNENMDLASGL